MRKLAVLGALVALSTLASVAPTFAQDDGGGASDSGAAAAPDSSLPVADAALPVVDPAVPTADPLLTTPDPFSDIPWTTTSFDNGTKPPPPAGEPDIVGNIR
jgi:hypothetical protein